VLLSLGLHRWWRNIAWRRGVDAQLNPPLGLRQLHQRRRQSFTIRVYPHRDVQHRFVREAMMLFILRCRIGRGAGQRLLNEEQPRRTAPTRDATIVDERAAMGEQPAEAGASFRRIRGEWRDAHVGERGGRRPWT